MPASRRATSTADSAYSLELPAGTDVERLLDQAVTAWGAERAGRLSGGTIHLPVLAGLRRGVMLVRTRLVDGRLDLEVESESWKLHRGAAVILAGGALGAGSLVLWPFFPALLAVAPIGIFLAIGAWLLVAARLRNAGPHEFLQLVDEIAQGVGPDPSPGTLE